MVDASRRSVGKALAPAMTLNRMYHCVPSTISGLSQMFGSSRSDTMPATAIGNSTLAGKAARNCATGCTRWAAQGRSPIHTPIGTQIALAMAMSTTTRASVNRPNQPAASASAMPRLART
jgi:hypothetical protein